MSIFRRNSEDVKENEEHDFDFSVLWQDEEASNWLAYIPHIIEIVLLIWLITKI